MWTAALHIRCDGDRLAPVPAGRDGRTSRPGAGGAWLLVAALATLGLSASNAWGQDVYSSGNGGRSPSSDQAAPDPQREPERFYAYMISRGYCPDGPGLQPGWHACPPGSNIVRPKGIGGQGDVFSARSGSVAPGPPGGPSGSDQFSAGGWQTTSVIRGSQQVLGRCKLIRNPDEVICDDGLDPDGRPIVRPKGWSGIGSSSPTTSFSPPRPAPRTIGNRGLTPQQAQERQKRYDAINSRYDVQVFNAWAKAKGYPPYEAGPSISNIGGKAGFSPHTQFKVVKTTKTTQRGATRAALPSRSSGSRRTTTQTSASDPNAIFRLKSAPR